MERFYRTTFAASSCYGFAAVAGIQWDDFDEAPLDYIARREREIPAMDALNNEY